MGDQGVGVDIQAEAAKQRDEYKRAAVIAAGHEGKTLFIRKHFHGSRATIIAAGHEGKSVVQRKHFHSS
jgi:hypothetical protein